MKDDYSEPKLWTDVVWMGNRWGLTLSLHISYLYITIGMLGIHKVPASEKTLMRRIFDGKSPLMPGKNSGGWIQQCNEIH